MEHCLDVKSFECDDVIREEEVTNQVNIAFYSPVINRI